MFFGGIRYWGNIEKKANCAIWPLESGVLLRMYEPYRIGILELLELVGGLVPGCHLGEVEDVLHGEEKCYAGGNVSTFTTQVSPFARVKSQARTELSFLFEQLAMGNPSYTRNDFVLSRVYRVIAHHLQSFLFNPRENFR